jgi:hypothetical protein
MIIDCFPYFNEKELLELRIKLLKDKVDVFIITEANRTHSGKPKNMSLIEDLKSMSDIPLEKIFYVPVELPSFENEPNNWIRERMQRDAAGKYIKEGDIAYVSDIDEIINPDIFEYYVNTAQAHKANILRVPLVFLCAQANLRVHNTEMNPVVWDSPFFVMKNHINRYTLSEIRESKALNKNNIPFTDIFITEGGKIQESGWHFTWMGDDNRRKMKLDSFLHAHEVNLTENYKPTNGSLDPLGRHDHILLKYPEEKLPKLIHELPNVKSFLIPNEVINDSTNNKPEEKSLLSILEKNPEITTDKNSVCFYKYNDKYKFLQYHSYIENFYEEYFSKYRDKKNSILEIGIDTGGSIALWHEYFSNSTIVGVDIKKERLQNEYDEDKFERAIYTYVKDAYDPIFINSLNNFDIIIDDGPHTFESQLVTIKNYLHKLNDGGLLVIEDIASIENAKKLFDAVPNDGIYEKLIVDLREQDKRYDSIMLAVKKG